MHEINTKEAPSPIGSYSQGVKSGQTTYISGQIGIHPETQQLIGPDFEAQCHQAFKNLKAVTEAGGGKVHEITKLTIYITDFNNFAALNSIMAQ